MSISANLLGFVTSTGSITPVVKNPQFKYCLSWALKLFGNIYDINMVVITALQPQTTETSAYSRTARSTFLYGSARSSSLRGNWFKGQERICVRAVNSVVQVNDHLFEACWKESQARIVRVQADAEVHWRGDRSHAPKATSWSCERPASKSSKVSSLWYQLPDFNVCSCSAMVYEELRGGPVCGWCVIDKRRA